MSRCTMGVGCDEYGVCYASAHGRPEMCPRDDSAVERIARVIAWFDTEQSDVISDGQRLLATYIANALPELKPNGESR